LTIEEVDPARVTPSQQSGQTESTLALSQASASQHSPSDNQVVSLCPNQMTELFEFVSEHLGVNKLKEEVTQLQVANMQLQERLETNVVGLKDTVQSLQTVMLQQMKTQEANRQAQIQLIEANHQAQAKEQWDQMMALFANLQTGQSVACITTGEIQDISPLSTQTTDSSAKRSPEETHEHISKKTKSGQSSPKLHPAGTSHSPPSNMAEETRGKPP
jgi:hypothetical protein